MNLKAFRLLLMMALSGVLVFGLAACGDDGDDDDDMMGDDDDDMGDDDDDMGDDDDDDGVGDFIPEAGGDADNGGTPPGFLDSSATYIGAEEPGTSAADAWWNGWATFDGQDECPDGNETMTVDANITSDTTWESDTCYVMTTQVFVVGTEETPTVLTIQPGTFIQGSGDDTALVITTTGQLEANGTATDPIVFTSSEDAGSRGSGDWGGLILLGNATLNVPGGSTVIEGLTDEELGTYGGNDDSHDCGTLRYLRVEWTGFALSGANEINGITMGGCGSDTEVDFVQVFVGDDDGIEIFGGTLNVSHALVFGQADDGFDFDQGWTGALQFAVSWNFAGERSNEWDNNGDGRTLEPFTEPTVYNGTYVGLNGSGRECFRLREGVKADINNVLCQDYSADQCVEIQHPETGLNVDDGSLTVSNGIFNNCGTAFRFRHGDSCPKGTCNQDFGAATCDDDPEDPECSLDTEFVPPFADAEFNNVVDSDSTVTVPATPPGFGE